MATTGAPWNIAYPTSGDNVAPLENVFSTQATSVHNALNSLKTGVPTGIGTTANRPSASTAGRTYYATDTGITWYDNGSTWKNRTPNIQASLVSTTGTTNGSQAVSWLTTASGFAGIDTGNFYSAGAPTRVTVPYDGLYEVHFTGRTSGVAGVTWNGAINGGATNGYLSASGVGVAGAATAGTRATAMVFSAGDYIIWTQVSTAVASGNHTVVVKYLGEQ